MYDLDQEILSYLYQVNKKVNIFHLKKVLNIQGEELQEEFDKSLKKLEENAEVIIFGNRIMPFFKNSNYHQGTISINQKGCGFVGDFFINEEDINGALNGDLVLISKEKCEDRKKGVVEKIIKRKHENIICLFDKDTLKPYGIKTDYKIKIKENDLKKLEDQDLVSVQLSNKLDKKTLHVISMEKIINQQSPDYEEKVIAIKHNFPIEFSNDALKEAENINPEITEKDLLERQDLRNSLVFTIDNDHTKDMDDAVSITKLSNNHYFLGVHIAHVSHYVKKDSQLWKEAYQRATSLYLNNSVFPMLPKRLSNDICSLNPNEDKLTISTFMEFDEIGKCISYKIIPSIIRSKAKLSYSKVNEILEDNINSNNYSNDIVNALYLMNELSSKIDCQKELRGQLTFASSEYDVSYDKSNNAKEFLHHKQRSAEKLIENFMIEANECTAAQYSWMPFLFRIHEKPNLEKLRQTLTMIKNNYSNIDIPITNNYHNKSIQNILNRLRESDDYLTFSNLILPCMARARFSAYNTGHFGLALNYYSQSTSPIRRFNDLVIQHLMDNSNDITYCENMESYLNEVASHCSTREREADLAEHEAQNILMAKYMQPFINQEFIGKITRIGQNTLEVEIENNIKGIVPKENILCGKYKYNHLKMKYIETFKKETLEIGDKVQLRLNQVSTEFGTIKFELLNKLEKEKVLSLSKNR